MDIDQLVGVIDDMIISGNRIRCRDENTSYYLKDMFRYLDGNIFYDIRDVYIPKEERGRGKGSSLVRQVIGDVGNMVVASLVGPSKIEYSLQKMPEEELDILMKDLDRFFRKLGFININDIVGYYASYASYLYIGNEAGIYFWGNLVQKATENITDESCRRFLDRYRDLTQFR